MRNQNKPTAGSTCLWAVLPPCSIYWRSHKLFYCSSKGCTSYLRAFHCSPLGEPRQPVGRGEELIAQSQGMLELAIGATSRLCLTKVGYGWEFCLNVFSSLFWWLAELACDADWLSCLKPHVVGGLEQQ